MASERALKKVEEQWPDAAACRIYLAKQRADTRSQTAPCCRQGHLVVCDDEMCCSSCGSRYRITIETAFHDLDDVWLTVAFRCLALLLHDQRPGIAVGDVVQIYDRLCASSAPWISPDPLTGKSRGAAPHTGRALGVLWIIRDLLARAGRVALHAKVLAMPIEIPPYLRVLWRLPQEGKAPLLILLEERGDTVGRLRIAPYQEFSYETIADQLSSLINDGTQIVGDWPQKDMDRASRSCDDFDCYLDSCLDGCSRQTGDQVCQPSFTYKLSYEMLEEVKDYKQFHPNNGEHEGQICLDELYPIVKHTDIFYKWVSKSHQEAMRCLFVEFAIDEFVFWQNYREPRHNAKYKFDRLIKCAVSAGIRDQLTLNNDGASTALAEEYAIITECQGKTAVRSVTFFTGVAKTIGRYASKMEVEAAEMWEEADFADKRCPSAKSDDLYEYVEVRKKQKPCGKGRPPEYKWSKQEETLLP